MGKSFKITIFLLVLLQTNLLAAGKRELIILLDWNNEYVEMDLNKGISGFGPNSSDLIQAVWQKAAPILVTSATWRNVMQRKQIFSDFTTKDTAALVKEYKGKFAKFNTDKAIAEFAQQCKDTFRFFQRPMIGAMMIGAFPYLRSIGNDFYLPYTMPFNPEEWIMERFGNFFILLIPKEYIEAQRAKGDLIKTVPELAKPLADRELLLGLKSGKPVQNPTDYTQFTAPLTFDYRAAFMKILPELFVTKVNVQDKFGDKQKTEENIVNYLHSWYIYFSGHGAPSKQGVPGILAGLKMEDFKQFLFFLNNQMTTDFLFYNTCYAGGEHLLYPFERSWFYPPLKIGKDPRHATRPEQLNYVVVASTLAYAVSSVWIPIPEKLGTVIKYTQQFKQFFGYIERYFYPVGQPIKDTLISILNLINPTLFEEGKIQVPVVRYPGTEWFSVVDLKKHVLRLTKTLVETREAEGKPIGVSDQQLIIVNPSQFVGRRIITGEKPHSAVLVPLQFTKNKMPAIISGAAIEATHYFEDMQAKQIGFIDFLKSFYKVKEEHGRTFYIKRLMCFNDLGTQQAGLINASPGNLLLNNVVVIVNDQDPTNPARKQKVNGVMFTYRKKHYQALWPVIGKMEQSEFMAGKDVPQLKVATMAPPTYPYEIPKARLSKVVAALKKRPAEPPAVQEPVADVTVLSKQLNQLSQQLGQLTDQLRGLTS